jgi:hypothetical protein
VWQLKEIRGNTGKGKLPMSLGKILVKTHFWIV